MGRPFLIAVVLFAAVAATPAQTPEDRKRARLQNQLGWEQMTAERWEGAARSFQHAIDIDRNFEDAYYGLGRANMALKNYVAAIRALTACRDLYVAAAGRQFSNAQEGQRYRRDKILEIDEQIRQVQSGRQTLQTQDQLRQLQNVRRDVQESIQRGNNMSISAVVPPWVSLSLGSAYFRAGRLADAEREYKATVTADNRSGEAHNNLAVVYLETGRIADADDALRAAKKAGFKVNPQLERDIKERLR